MRGGPDLPPGTGAPQGLGWGSTGLRLSVRCSNRRAPSESRWARSGHRGPGRGLPSRRDLRPQAGKAGGRQVRQHQIQLRAFRIQAQGLGSGPGRQMGLEGTFVLDPGPGVGRGGAEGEDRRARDDPGLPGRGSTRGPEAETRGWVCTEGKVHTQGPRTPKSPQARGLKWATGAWLVSWARRAGSLERWASAGARPGERSEL